MAFDSDTVGATATDRSQVLGPSGGCASCFLASTCLPGQLAPLDVARLRQIVRTLPPLRAQQTLFDGSSARGMLFIVRAGCLRTSVREPTGADAVIDFLLPGDLTGFGVTGDGPLRPRAVALQRSNVCAIRFADLHGLAARVPGLQEQLYRLIDRAANNQSEHVLMMGHRSAPQRLALFLLTWARRRRQVGFSDSDLDLPMRREDLASYLGLVTETTSRAVSRLQASGLIEVIGRHRILLLEARGLAELAGTEPDADPVAETG